MTTVEVMSGVSHSNGALPANPRISVVILILRFLDPLTLPSLLAAPGEESRNELRRPVRPETQPTHVTIQMQEWQAMSSGDGLAHWFDETRQLAFIEDCERVRLSKVQLRRICEGEGRVRVNGHASTLHFCARC